MQTLSRTAVFLAVGALSAQASPAQAAPVQEPPAAASKEPAPPSPPAQEPARKEPTTQDLEDRVRRLEEEIQALKQAPPPPPPDQAPAQIGGAGAAAGKALNPDISLIGDFLASTGHNDVRPVPSLDMHEAEVGIQAIIDPYSRGDVFLSFGNDSVEVEEAFVTFTSLPWGLTGKVGKMRAAFGKVNAQHNHTLPWTDRPLVTENLVNGEDGIDDMGVSLTSILPAPGDLYLEGTFQAFRGDSGTLFTATQKRDLSYVGHLRAYEDLTENTNLELGVSQARGHNALGSDYRTILTGADLTLRWKPLMRSIYQSFTWRTEAIWSHREELAGPVRSSGLYSSLEARLSQRWTIGARYDWSQRATDSNQVDKGGSLLATYWFSEFSQLRGQYRQTRYDGGQNASELRLQLLFVMGAHGAHPF